MRVIDYVYLGVIGVAAYFAYDFYETWWKPGAGLDKFAEGAGAQASATTYGPQILYAKARSAYAKSIGMHGYDLLPGWPDENQWENYGDGPKGFRYGDPDYPKVRESTMAESFFSFISGGAE